MLLTLWVVLSTAGLVAFLLGHLLGFHGVATIGAVMVMLAGADVVLGGIEVADGETIERNYSNVSGEVVAVNETVTDTYSNYSWTERFASDYAVGIGVFQLLIGVLLFYQQMLAIGEGQ